MKTINRKRLFLSAFFILLLLILLLGETFLKWYLYGLGGILFLFFSKDLDMRKLFLFKKIILIWLVFIVWILVSFFWTIGVSLTLSSLFFYLFSFIFFILFLSLPKGFLNKKEFVLGLITMGFILSILSYFFLFNPGLSTSLPGMNLIYFTYGHNHLSALLLFVLPLSWWWFFSERINQRKFPTILIIFFTLTLVLSLGRVATAIGLVQLALIAFIFRKKKENKKLLKIVFFFLSFLFLAKIFLSFDGVLFKNYICESSLKSVSKLCKSFKAESRIYYWKQSLLAIKDNPILGTGAGTFELLSEKYKLLPWASSKYAHNAFLKVFSELGLIGGGFFLLLMLKQLFFSFVVAKQESKSNFSINMALFIAIFSSYLDSLFDFDWSFSSIFLLTLVFISIILNSKKTDYLKKEGNEYFEKLLKKIFNFIAIILIMFSVLFAATEVLTRTGRYDKAFNLFPFFNSHKLVFVKESNLSQSQIDKWSHIYRSDSYSYVSFLLKKDPDSDQDIFLKLKLFEIKPWKRLDYQETISELIERKEYDLAQKEVYSWAELRKKLNFAGQEIDYEDRKELAKSIVKLGDVYYLDNNYQDSLNLYLLAYDFDDWIFSEFETAILREKDAPMGKHELVSKSELIMFLSRGVDAEKFGLLRNEYANKQEVLLLSLLADGSFSCCSDLVIEISEQIIYKSPWLERILWNSISGELLDKTEKFVDLKNLDLAQKNLEILYDYWKHASGKTDDISYDNREKLAEMLVDVGNEFVFLDTDTAASNYLKAQEVIPWIFTYKESL